MFQRLLHQVQTLDSAIFLPLAASRLWLMEPAKDNIPVSYVLYTTASPIPT